MYAVYFWAQSRWADFEENLGRAVELFPRYQSRSSSFVLFIQELSLSAGARLDKDPGYTLL